MGFPGQWLKCEEGDLKQGRGVKTWPEGARYEAVPRDRVSAQIRAPPASLPPDAGNIKLGGNLYPVTSAV